MDSGQGARVVILSVKLGLIGFLVAMFLLCFAAFSPWKAQAAQPEGILDNAYGTGGAVYVYGWIYDSDSPSTSILIHVYLKNSAGKSTFIAERRADKTRKDVHKVYGIGTKHGFEEMLSVSEVGTYTVCVFGINVGKGSNQLIAERKVTIKKDTTVPTISDAAITKITPSSYTISCSVKDNFGINSVWCPTLAAQGTGNEWKWYSASVSNGKAVCTIPAPTSETYYTDIHVYDYANNFSKQRVTCRIKNDSPFSYSLSDGKYVISACGTTAHGIVTVPSTVQGRAVTGISNGAFRGCSDICSVFIPESVTKLGDACFKDCKNLQSVVIPGTLANAGDKLFEGCDALTDIYYLGTPSQWESSGLWQAGSGLVSSGATVHPGTLVSYDTGSGGVKLKLRCTYEGFTVVSCDVDAEGDVDVPVSISGIPVVAVEEEAFKDCAKIASVVLPEGIVRIGARAFSACLELKSVTVPATLKSFGDAPFAGCTTLTDIYYRESLATWNFIVFGNNGLETSATIHYNGYRIPGTDVFLSVYTDNGGYVIAGCNKDASGEVVLPAEIGGIPIRGIDARAFDGCSKVRRIVIPENIAEIGNYVFQDCTALEDVQWPMSLTTLGRSIFDGCPSLKNIYYPGSAADWNKVSLLSGAFDKERVLRFNSYRVPDTDAVLGLLKEKAGYAVVSCDISAAGHIALPARIGNLPVTRIGNGAFSECNKIESLEIPEGCMRLGAEALKGCSSLHAIMLPESLAAIGSSAFSGCDNLGRVYYAGTQNSWAGISKEGEGLGVSDFSVLYDVEEHVYDVSVVEPTCTDDGYTKHECTKCGFSYVDNYVAKTGHSPIVVEGHVATCQDMGLTNGEICSSCGATLVAQEEIPALGHDWSEVVVRKATYDEEGEIEHVCAHDASHNYTETTPRLSRGSDDSGGFLSGVVTNSAVRLSAARLAWTGSRRAPSVTVVVGGAALAEGRDYSLSFSGACRDVGPYTVTVSGKGSYSGTATARFSVVPPAPRLRSVRAVRGSNGSGFRARWRAGALRPDGWQVRWSRSKSMSRAKSARVKASSKAGRRLSLAKRAPGSWRGKRAWVQVRAYKRAGGETLYSDWSAPKGVRVRR